MLDKITCEPKIANLYIKSYTSFSLKIEVQYTSEQNIICSLPLLDFTRNFQLVDEAMSTTNDLPYDYDSIMHYDAYAFSRNDRPTIEPLDDSISLDRLGQRTHLSELDLDHIKELYCQGTASASDHSVLSYCVM